LAATLIRIQIFLIFLLYLTLRNRTTSSAALVVSVSW